MMFNNSVSTWKKANGIVLISFCLVITIKRFCCLIWESGETSCWKNLDQMVGQDIAATVPWYFKCCNRDYIKLTIPGFRSVVCGCKVTNALRRLLPEVRLSVTPPFASGSFKMDTKKCVLVRHTMQLYIMQNTWPYVRPSKCIRCLGPLVKYVSGTASLLRGRYVE